MNALEGFTHSILFTLSHEIICEEIGDSALVRPTNQCNLVSQISRYRDLRPDDIVESIQHFVTGAPSATGHMLLVDGGRTMIQIWELVLSTR